MCFRADTKYIKGIVFPTLFEIFTSIILNGNSYVCKHTSYIERKILKLFVIIKEKYLTTHAE